MTVCHTLLKLRMPPEDQGRNRVPQGATEVHTERSTGIFGNMKAVPPKVLVLRRTFVRIQQKQMMLAHTSCTTLAYLSTVSSENLFLNGMTM